MYDDGHPNFKDRHCACITSASPQSCEGKKSLKLGGNEVEVQFFA